MIDRHNNLTSVPEYCIRANEAAVAIAAVGSCCMLDGVLDCPPPIRNLAL